MAGAAAAGDFYRDQNDSNNSADDPLILGQYDLRDIEESLGEGDVAWGGGWQVKQNYLQNQWRIKEYMDLGYFHLT